MKKDNALSPLHDLIKAHANSLGGLMPLLHAIQAEYGYIPKEAAPSIAPIIKRSVAEIEGVISFYHQFKRSPQGAHRVQICRAEACQANGSRELEAAAKDLLGLDYGQTNEELSISLDPVYCLGNCACGPTVRIDERIYARVNSHKFTKLCSELGRSLSRSDIQPPTSSNR